MEAIMARDKEASDYFRFLPKRKRVQERCWMLAEQYNMARGDRESRTFATIDIMHQELKRYREMALQQSIPDPKFKCGQSVLQWYASWMKSAQQTPRTYNKKSRPVWFSADAFVFHRDATAPSTAMHRSFGHPFLFDLESQNR